MSYFNYLRTFIAVYRCGSHNKASNVLGLTQPAISRHIAALEQQLGKQLFHRDGPKRYKPTQIAHALAHEFSAHIDQIERIFNASRATSVNLHGMIYIGGFAEFIEQHLTHTIAALVPHEIQFIVQAVKGTDWLGQLNSGSLDMAIVPFLSGAEGIGYQELLADDLVVAVNPRVESFAQLADIPYIAHAEDIPSIRNYLLTLPLNHKHLKRSVVVGSFTVIRGLILRGAGFSLLPRSLIERELSEGSIREIPYAGKPPRLHLYLAWNKSSLRKPRTLFVRDAILDHFALPKPQKPRL